MKPDEGGVEGLGATYVINMRGATDRMRGMTDKVRGAGLDFIRVEGVDGRVAALTRTPDIHQWCSLTCTPGVIGCALSHMDVWRRCRAEGHAAALVLEDDAVLVPGFAKKLERALARVPKDYDVLLLGYDDSAHWRPTMSVMPTGRTARRVSPDFAEPAAFYGTHAYVVSEKGARALRDMRATFQIDIQMSMTPSLRIYAATPKLATAEIGTSFVAPSDFPAGLNALVRQIEVPGLNVYGRSQPPSAMWFVLVCILGYLRVCPTWVAVALVVEAAVGGVSGWWVASTTAWLIFSSVRTSRTP